MAFNPSPKVRAAADFAKEFDQTHVVIISVNMRKRELSYASYGKNETACDDAKALAEHLYSAAMEFLTATPPGANAGR